MSLKPSTSGEGNTNLKWARSVLLCQAVPIEIEIRDACPRITSGKIDRREPEHEHTQEVQTLRNLDAPPRPTATIIVNTLLNGAQKIGLDDELLMDGYVDSVGTMRLVSYIGELISVKTRPEDFTTENFGTITALSKYLEQKQSP